MSVPASTGWLPFRPAPGGPGGGSHWQGGAMDGITDWAVLVAAGSSFLLGGCGTEPW
jgi:hypothetical protein